MLFFILIAAFGFIVIGAYYLQEKLIFYPETLPQNYQFDFPQEFAEVNFQVTNEISIDALHFKAKNSKGVVFYSHGNAGSLRGWGNIAEIFLEYGYDVLIYDYRGYGKSNGSISEENLYNDAIFIYNELMKMYDESKIVVYGRSIGTGIATKVAAENEPSILILESPFFNLPDVAKKIFPFIPSAIMRYKFPNDEMIPKVKCPVYIFHGTADEVIYFGSSLKLEKLMKKEDKLIAVKGGHHNDLENFEIYRIGLKKVLDNLN